MPKLEAKRGYPGESMRKKRKFSEISLAMVK